MTCAFAPVDLTLSLALEFILIQLMSCKLLFLMTTIVVNRIREEEKLAV